jgi:hypothetical protein
MAIDGGDAVEALVSYGSAEGEAVEAKWMITKAHIKGLRLPTFCFCTIRQATTAMHVASPVVSLVQKAAKPECLPLFRRGPS